MTGLVQTEVIARKWQTVKISSNWLFGGNSPSWKYENDDDDDENGDDDNGDYYCKAKSHPPFYWTQVR